MAGFDPSGDRTVAVSGAGTGIGRAVAVAFGELGWRVAVGGRRVEHLTETARLVEAAGGTCAAHELDVTDPGSVEAFFAAAEADLGLISAVVNNAATARYGPLEEFSPAEIEREVATKLTGGLLMARQAILRLKEMASPGDVLFVTSSAGVHPWPFHLPYAAANAGVEHAARTLRLELEGSGIRVNVLRCGETGGTDFATREVENGRMGPAHELWFRRGLLRHTGLMTPEVVAQAVRTAITLPLGHQYEVLAVMPTAPPGQLPRTHEELVAQMMAGSPPPPTEGGA